jgi:hypothetical protein
VLMAAALALLAGALGAGLAGFADHRHAHRAAQSPWRPKAEVNGRRARPAREAGPVPPAPSPFLALRIRLRRTAA